MLERVGDFGGFRSHRDKYLTPDEGVIRPELVLGSVAIHIPGFFLGVADGGENENETALLVSLEAEAQDRTRFGFAVFHETGQAINWHRRIIATHPNAPSKNDFVRRGGFDANGCTN